MVNDVELNQAVEAHQRKLQLKYSKVYLIILGTN